MPWGAAGPGMVPVGLSVGSWSPVLVLEPLLALLGASFRTSSCPPPRWLWLLLKCSRTGLWVRNELQEHMGCVKHLVLLSFGSDVNTTLTRVRET